MRRVGVRRTFKVPNPRVVRVIGHGPPRACAGARAARGRTLPDLVRPSGAVS